MTIAYLANSFPEAVEPYVWEEIEELCRRGLDVLPCGIRRPNVTAPECKIPSSAITYVFPLRFLTFLHAHWLLLRNLPALCGFLWRAVRGPEKLPRRFRTLVHTWLGAYLAAVLQKKQIRHIHVHHGYFAAWVGMVAARMLHAGFSMTLHGSDLLVRKDYLDAKLAACEFCFTVSDFNRQHILKHYPADPEKIVVRRLGVDPGRWQPSSSNRVKTFTILSAGRLHPVKNHEFLIRACHLLKTSGLAFRCLIAGEGPYRASLEGMIDRLGVQREVILLGHVNRRDLSAFYSTADVVVLTSHSEGIPVTLMEAMAMERVVLAPRITGIPELITNGINGFVYSSGSIVDFVDKLTAINCAGEQLHGIRQAAQDQIECKFNGPENLARFADDFFTRVNCKVIRERRFPCAVSPNGLDLNAEPHFHADSLLQ